MRITIKDIAKIANVSRGTVDRVVNKRSGVRPETKEKVEKILKEHSYKPNIVAKALRSSKKRFSIGVLLGPMGKEFSEQIKMGVDLISEDYKSIGVEVVSAYNQLATEDTIKEIYEMLERGIDGLAIRTVDTIPIRVLVDDLANKGVPVVAYNMDILKCKRICYVGHDYEEAGKVSGRLMGKVLHGRGNVIIVVEDAETSGHAQRVNAFMELIKKDYPGIKILDVIYASQIMQHEYQLTLECLKKHQNITGIYSSSASPGIIKAVRELNLADQITLIVPDMIPSVVDTLLEDDCVDFLIDQQPQKQAAYAIKVLVDYLYYNIVPLRDKFLCQIGIHVRETANNAVQDIIFDGSIIKP